MKIETLWELLQDEKYACLTVAEFVEIIKDSRVMEEDDISFLTDPDWKPETVTYYGDENSKLNRTGGK